MPSGLWHHEFIAYLLQRLDKNDNKLRAWDFQDKNADKLPSLQEPSGRRLAGFVRPRASLPRTTKNKPAHCTACWSSMAKILFKDPEVLLAAELCLWPWRLQEQAHGASVRVPSRWGAQSGHWQRPHQLDNVELDSSNKAEAAGLVEASSKPASLAFLEGTAIPPRCSQNFFGD